MDDDTHPEEPPADSEPRRDRLTGDDVEARLRRWHSRTRDHLTPQLGRRVTIGALVVALLGVGAANGALETSYRSQYAANAEKIATLQHDLDAAGGAGATVSATGADAAVRAAAKDLDGFVDRANAAASRVADGQQRYAALAWAATPSSASAGNGAPSAEVLAMVDHRKDLAGLWEPASLVATDDDAYAYSSASALDDPSRIDPRFPWYVRYDATTASSPDTYSWSVETVMPLTPQSAASSTAASPSQTRADVVWVCRENGGDRAILAWASAVFDDGTGRFHDLALNVTAAGAQHRSTSSATTSTSQKKNG